MSTHPTLPAPPNVNSDTTIHKVVVTLTGDQIDEALAALRRAAASPMTSVFDHVSLLELARQLDEARVEIGDAGDDSEPVEVEFTPRGEQGTA